MHAMRVCLNPMARPATGFHCRRTLNKVHTVLAPHGGGPLLLLRLNPPVQAAPLLPGWERRQARR